MSRKIRKYYAPPGELVRFYIPPGYGLEAYARDATEPLIITEGEKKALKACKAGPPGRVGR